MKCSSYVHRMFYIWTYLQKKFFLCPKEYLLDDVFMLCEINWTFAFTSFHTMSKHKKIHETNNKNNKNNCL